MFRYLVLGLLRAEEPLHGYALMKAYCERSGTKISTGSFYRELARLVAEGLVAPAVRPPDSAPRRAPYRISARGAAEFDAWLAAPHRSTMGSHDDELSVAILFITRADPEVARKLFRSVQEDLWMRSKSLEWAREGRTAGPGAVNRFHARDLLLARRQKHVAAEIEFLEELRSAYDQWATAEAAKPGRSAAGERAVSRKAKTDTR